MVTKQRKREAFLLADAMMGIAILATLIAVFAGALGAQNRSSQRLADSRAAWRAAESALSELQAGRATNRAEMNSGTGGRAPAGFVWVEAVASSGNAKGAARGARA